MDGVLIVDKPSGMSSFDVIRALGKKFPKTKMGHLGTLDPLATGVLVVFLGKATQLIRYFSELGKEYEVVLELGKVSDTYDVTGKVKDSKGSKGWKDSKESFEEVLKTFIGPQWQIQPPFSAIRYQGKRAYEFAREGKHVDLGKRRIEIQRIELVESGPPFHNLRLSCSSGTYVRSFVHELGQALGTGAIMTALRRTRVGTFRIEHAHPLDAIRAEDILPSAMIVSEYLDIPEREKIFLLKRFS